MRLSLYRFQSCTPALNSQMGTQFSIYLIAFAYTWANIYSFNKSYGLSQYPLGRFAGRDSAAAWVKRVLQKQVPSAVLVLGQLQAFSRGADQGRRGGGGLLGWWDRA
jgi:hypothetical protein